MTDIGVLQLLQTKQ